MLSWHPKKPPTSKMKPCHVQISPDDPDPRDETRRNDIRLIFVLIAVLSFLTMAALADVWMLQCQVNQLQSQLESKFRLLPPADGRPDVVAEGIANQRGDEEDENQDNANSLNSSSPGHRLVHGLDPYDVFPLSRRARTAENASDGKEKKKRRNGRKGKKGKRRRGRGKGLPVELYSGSWRASWDPPKGNCGKTRQLPGNPITCLSKSIIYADKASVIAFHRKEVFADLTLGRKRRPPPQLLELDPHTGRYTVKTSGIFMFHLDMTMKDPGLKHAAGIFSNGRPLFACPLGGARCSETNERDSVVFRLCSVNGIAKLQENDVIDIRAMEENMVIKVKLRSDFWVILLAKHNNV